MSRSLPQPLDASHALFLDFDGTLTPLQDDADKVHLSEAKTHWLSELAAHLGGALAIISGRDVRDLSRRTPDTLLRIGNHGLYRLDPGQTALPALAALPTSAQAALQDIAASHDKVFLEEKGPVGTLHFRANPQAGPTIIGALRKLADAVPDYGCKVGNHVAELIPDHANKGAALTRTMTAPPFIGRIPVMIGDDTTDEDGFIAAKALGGFGIKVGPGDTAATARLASVDAVWAWLKGTK